MRSVTSFVCQECGYDSPQWLGKCPECGNWNTLKEFQTSRLQLPSQSDGGQAKFKLQDSKTKELNLTPKLLQDIKPKEDIRLRTGFSEMDTVLGGGIVKGSVALLAGDPGVVKSTLLLQLALNISNNYKVVLSEAKDPIKEKLEILSPRQVFDSEAQTRRARGQNDKEKVLYISGEESEEQVSIRAKRLTYSSNTKQLFLLSLTNTDAIISVIEKIQPSLVIIDSVQTMESEQVGGMSGSVGQVRYATATFIKTAKTHGIPMILIGHVTKEGMVAGPMMLSHMVDTVLFLEGEQSSRVRILRSIKNRFGPIDEVGVFSMEEEGLSEVKNPQHLFLSERNNSACGSVLVATLEGTRAFLVEIQGLVVFSKLPIPRRVASGIDQRRLELLLAVMQKQCHLPVGGMDVFVNVAGGIKVTDAASDLGICLALFSSFKNVPLINTVAIAEVGLLGELRMVSSLEKRVREAKKLGFNDIVSTKTHKTLKDITSTLDKKMPHKETESFQIHDWRRG